MSERVNIEKFSKLCPNVGGLVSKNYYCGFKIQSEFQQGMSGKNEVFGLSFKV